MIEFAIKPSRRDAAGAAVSSVEKNGFDLHHNIARRRVQQQQYKDRAEPCQIQRRQKEVSRAGAFIINATVAQKCIRKWGIFLRNDKQ